MSKLDTGPYKGVRDFFPKDQAIQNHIFSTWRKTLESYGYEEYSASILEPAELYRAKTGEEIVNEQTYTFKDRGDREVTLRPEMTPTVARMVAARRRELGFPLRWYSIPNLFRYEAPQRGRLREHWQLNTDIFGLENIQAEIEIITIAHAIMKNFGASEQDFEIRINDLKATEEYLLKEGVPENRLNDARRLIDKKNKITNFDEEMEKIAGKKITLDIEPTQNIIKILDTLRERGVHNIRFEPTLARGFDYYTGTVFEVFDTDPKNPRSLFGGGRYNELLSLFGNDTVPAVGFGSGDVTMRDFLETHNLLPQTLSSTHLYIALLSNEYAEDAESLARILREDDVNVAIDWSERKLGDQIKTADKHGIPYVLIFGENEAKSKMFSVKNLNTGDEKEVRASEIAGIVLNR